MTKTNETRVYGPPGVGKTSWIAREASKCAEKYGGDQVSLCSLTNTAIQEVFGREIPVPKENISTLHARCKRSLSAPDPAESHADEFIKGCPRWSSIGGYDPCLPAWMSHGKKDSTDGEFVLSGGAVSLYDKAQLLRQGMVPKEKWPSVVRQWYSAWSSWCRESGRMDFTGWLEAALEVRPLPPQQILFVDEAQDHTPLQLAVIRGWQTRHRVLIGDADQCVYEWSGASPQEFIKDHPDCVGERVLEQSYRVPISVHRFAVRWINQIRNRKPIIYKPRPEEGKLMYSPYTLNDAKDGDLPEGLLENHDKTYMIIASCGYMLDDIINILKSKGIPFHNPYRKSNLKWNPLENLGYRIDSFLQKTWTGEEAKSWAEILRSKDVFMIGRKRSFLSFCDEKSDIRLTERDIFSFFTEMAMGMIREKDLNLLAKFKSLGVAGSWKYARKVYAKSKEDRKPKLIIGTVHSIKGGESSHVYLFPDMSPAGMYDYHGVNKGRIHRLFYVGATRAKQTLTLCEQSRPFLAVDWV